MSQPPATTSSARTQWISAALFTALGLGVLYWFISFAEPPERTHQAPFRLDYSEAPLLTALQGTGYAARVHTIGTFGSRLSGSPGFYQTEEYIQREFRAAGLTVQTQEFPVVVPETEVCQILDARGQPLPGVQLFPFTPAGLTPISCLVSGTLVATEGAELKFLAGHDPRQTIAVTYLDTAAGWRNFAAVGSFERGAAVRASSSTSAMPPEPPSWAICTVTSG